MPFEVLTLVGPRHHVLDWVQIPHVRGSFDGKREQPIVKYSTSRVAIWDMDLVALRKRVLDGVVHWQNLANTIEPSMCRST